MQNVVIDQVLEPGVRVTVAMGTDRNLCTGTSLQVVQSSTPREEEGMYWGYKVRYAPNLSSVIENCSYEGSYDHVIGTSEHGEVVKSSALCIPAFRHLLIAFGGLAGLEECIEKDKKLREAVLIALQYFQEPIERASLNG
ncbi:putative methyltransferase C9orf114-like protein [Bienertia sinuspersici]